MASSLQRFLWVLVCAASAHALFACTSERVVGDQCPGPYDKGATVAGEVIADETLVGTSCAPCDGKPHLDARGCPRFVTFESCGGDICIGGNRVGAAIDGGPDASDDNDAGDEGDAGDTEDDDAG